MSKYINSLKQIIEGWSNYWFDNQEVKELAEKRASICAECPLNVNNVCSKSKSGKAVITFNYKEELRIKDKEYNGCGCYLSAKTRSEESICPLGKW
jgi:hypothetical protein